MANFDPRLSPEAIRLTEVYGVFVRTPDDVEFRTGSMSGTACVVSDPEGRGLLGPVIERLLSPDLMQKRPWNEAEMELLEEILPQLQKSGIIEVEGPSGARDTSRGFCAPILRRPLAESRIAIVGHGVLGRAVQSLLTGVPCGSITLIESSSVARAGENAESGSPRPLPQSATVSAVPERLVARPRDRSQWAGAIGDHDWVVAAQDCFEPEELAALNRAALKHSMPWSLVCFDGYEGWIGPTFVPGQTACFSCFQRRLFAGAAEPEAYFYGPQCQSPPSSVAVVGWTRDRGLGIVSHLNVRT